MATIAGLALLSDPAGSPLSDAWDDPTTGCVQLSVVTFGAPTTVFAAKAGDHLSTVPQGHRKRFHNVFHSRDTVPFILNCGRAAMKERFGCWADAAATTAVMLATDKRTFTPGGLALILAYWLNHDNIGAHVGHIYFSLGYASTDRQIFRRAVTLHELHSLVQSANGAVKGNDINGMLAAHSMSGYVRLWRGYAGSSVRRQPVWQTAGQEESFVQRLLPAQLDIRSTKMVQRDVELLLTVKLGAPLSPHTFLRASLGDGSAQTLISPSDTCVFRQNSVCICLPDTGS